MPGTGRPSWPHRLPGKGLEENFVPDTGSHSWLHTLPGKGLAETGWEMPSPCRHWVKTRMMHPGHELDLPAEPVR